MSRFRDSSTLRGVLVLAVAMVAAGALAITPAVSAVDGLSKKEKKQGDKRWINVGEKASDADKLDGQDSSAFLGASAKAADADKLDGLDGVDYGETLWAVVENNGTLVRGHGVLQSFDFGTAGAFEIVFTRNIDQCAYTATVWDSTAGRGNTAPAGEVGVKPLSTSPSNGLSITTRDSAGTAVERDYIVVVHC
jgi:hypothetical protein